MSSRYNLLRPLVASALREDLPMGQPQPEPLYTVDEYLTIERAAEERHEFVDGRIYAMAGESGDHGDITVNIVVSLASQLKGTPCRARSKDTKVRSGPELK